MVLVQLLQLKICWSWNILTFDKYEQGFYYSFQYLALLPNKFLMMFMLMFMLFLLYFSDVRKYNLEMSQKYHWNYILQNAWIIFLIKYLIVSIRLSWFKYQINVLLKYANFLMTCIFLKLSTHNEETFCICNSAIQ